MPAYPALTPTAGRYARQRRRRAAPAPKAQAPPRLRRGGVLPSAERAPPVPASVFSADAENTEAGTFSPIQHRRAGKPARRKFAGESEFPLNARCFIQFALETLSSTSFLSIAQSSSIVIVPASSPERVLTETFPLSTSLSPTTSI